MTVKTIEFARVNGRATRSALWRQRQAFSCRGIHGGV